MNSSVLKDKKCSNLAKVTKRQADKKECIAKKKIDELSNRIKLKKKESMRLVRSPKNSQIRAASSNRGIAKSGSNPAFKSLDDPAPGGARQKEEHSEQPSDGPKDGNPKNPLALAKKRQNALQTKQAIENWIATVLARGVVGLKNEFKLTPVEVVGDECAAFYKYPDKSRYPNVPCVDRTRVCPSSAGEDFFIHANYVKIGNCKNRFVCTQGPLECTVNDFWKMTVALKSEFIVMLCSFIEDGVSKCAKYFPIVGETMDLEQVRIYNESVTELLPSCQKDRIVHQRLRVLSKIDNREQIVNHLHWLSWKDHGVPESFESPLKLLSYVRKTSVPIIVHCSAGVGRTGTLVFIEALIMAIRFPQKQDPKEAFLQLRSDRAKMIQTAQQFLFAYRCVLEYCFAKRHSKNEDKWNKFKEDYKTLMAKKRKVTDRKKKNYSMSMEEKEEKQPMGDRPEDKLVTASPSLDQQIQLQQQQSQQQTVLQSPQAPADEFTSVSVKNSSDKVPSDKATDKVNGEREASEPEDEQITQMQINEQLEKSDGNT